MGSVRHFRVWRGDETGGQLEDFKVEVNEGEVVLDVIHRLQATQAPDLAVRWNCKAGKCGSCSMGGHRQPPLGANPDRKEYAAEDQGLGYCNITKCCTEVCPEHIKITDNAIIPMKERVVDRRYDPVVWLGSKIFRRS